MSFTSLLLVTTAAAALAGPGHNHGGIPGATSSLQDAPVSEPAAAETDESWDVNDPPMERREIAINVTEGTWMSLDVSPDGRTIAFDLLGDIYTLPITGGVATPIASGMAWEIQPRFSPDGSRIAFTSDRAGGDNIWVMDADGSDARQISQESFRLLNSPAWHPNGEYIAARKHFTTSRSAGTGEIWLYHVDGGNGVQLVERPSEAFQKEQGEPAFSPDGRHVYFTRAVSPGNTFAYAEDSNRDAFNIRRYDMETGEVDTVVSGPGGAVRPEPSPDGNYLAFVRRERTQSMLYLKNLRSGEVRRIHADLDQDNQETWGVNGMYPTMDWTPDSRSIVFWAGGRINRIDIETEEVTVIPFEVNDTREIVDPIRPRIEVAPDTVETRMTRFARVSPEGDRVVFESLGRLWIKDLPDGQARPLTREGDQRRELFPDWSADGRTIVFVTWDDQDLGSIRTIRANGRGERVISPEPGVYRRPRFSPDGETIVFEKDSGGFLTAPEWGETTGIFTLAADGGAMHEVADSGSAPHFSPDGQRIFLTRAGESRQLVSVNLDGLDERVHASADLVGEYQVSPTGTHVAFRENYDTYVMPLLPGPQGLAAGRGGAAVPVAEASGNGSSYMHWSENGETINWSVGPVLYSASLDDLFPAPGSEEEFTPPEDGISLSVTAPAARPDGVVALVGARLITMAGEDGGVIEDGVVVIEDNRIAAVGPRGEVEIPAGANEIDVTGHTITPGFIDAHAHGPQGNDEIIPEQNWSAMAHLALGVTTIHDPSSQASHIFTAAEYQRAGRLLAPRTFSTGEIIYGARAPGFYAQIDSLDDAREHVFRLASQGAHSVKNYNQPRRDQRQQVVAASQEAGIMSVAEGGSNYHMDMALVADGNTTLEHNLPPSMLYEDVLSMYEQSDVGYTPTLAVTYGGLAGDPYWRMEMDVWRHPILAAHVPPRLLEASSVRRTKAPEEDFVDDDAANTARLLMERGVPVAIGAHGQQQGLAAHWEMWSFARGGMSPVQVLATATSMAAESLGMDRDIGTIEAGKLADLVVLRENPLEDIRNTDQIEYVMLDGRLYDADTLNEVETGDFRRQPYFWED